MTYITGAMLYDIVECPHRVSMDLFANYGDRDEISPFVQMLWEKETLHEKEIMAAMSEPYLDLSLYSGDEKEQKTLEAMADGVPLI